MSDVLTNLSTGRLRIAEAGATPWALAATGKAFGDSITKGTSGPTTGRHWVNLLASTCSISLTNAGVDGDQAADLSDDVLTELPAGRKVYTLMVGANDQRTYLTDTNKLQVFKDAMRAHLVWLGLPYAGKVLGTATTPTNYKPTLSGFASATAAWTTNHGKNSIVPGDTATFTTYGPVCYVTTMVQYQRVSTYSISIDGVSQGTFNVAAGSDVDFTTANGKTFAERCHRFAGLSSGAHTVVITVVAAQASHPVYFEWACGNRYAAGEWPREWLPRVVVGQVTKQSAAYPYGGSDANVATYNAAIKAIVDELVADGLNITLVDTTNAINQTTDLHADGIHVVDIGNEKLARAFADAILKV